MPYILDGNCVKKKTGETIKCHDTHAEALAHLQALEMNVSEAHKSMDNIIYISDGFVKSLNDSTGEIGGHSVIYGDNNAKDFHGNWFTPRTNTGFFSSDAIKYDVGLLNHRIPMFKKGQFDPDIEKVLREFSDKPFKNPVKTVIDKAIGEFSSLILDLSDKYEKMVFDLAKQGKLKWSSGAAPQTYKSLPSGELEMFVPAERSLTPIPAEYRMLEHRVMPLKAYTDFLKSDNLQPSSLDVFIKSYNVPDNFYKAMDEMNDQDQENMTEEMKKKKKKMNNQQEENDEPVDNLDEEKQE